MAAQRRQNPLRRRRRVEDEGEDEGSMTEPVEDSQSEASLHSDDDGDADDSDLSETDVPDAGSGHDESAKANGAMKQPALTSKGRVRSASAPLEKENGHRITHDTDVMMNGLQISENVEKVEAVDFYATRGAVPSPSTGKHKEEEVTDETRPQETLGERRRREHEEYKQKQDQDPAFIPNRGVFFMHDHRSAGPGQNGFRPFGRGRGRGGRGGGAIGGPFSPANMNAQTPDATSKPWSHDLHETLLDPPGRNQQPPTSAPVRFSVAAAPTTAGASKTPIVRQFSTIKDLAYVKLRVFIPGMKEAITYDNTKIRQHTKLPDHRPPLRRDKPVRVFLPNTGPQYYFPAVERSFIFIPRALRPNQQGFGRGRSRLGSLGGFSSRRTSIYGGSVYSPSIPMSRRSSLVREFTREGLISPSGSVRPIVRLPPGSQQHSAGGTPIYTHPMSGHGTPVMHTPALHGYPLPQKPAFRENWPANNVPMYQPRPQKTVSVSGIESPIYNPPAHQEQAPFHNQIPRHVNVNGGNAPPDFYPRQQNKYPSHTSSGTPLSNIPERAIHAPSFQPFQQATYPQPTPQFFYSPAQYPQQAVIAPVFIQNGSQGSFLVPAIAPAAPNPALQPTIAAPAQIGMVPHEQNGMVYYIPNEPMVPQQMYVPAEGYATSGNYTMPGMGGMMTPTPDGFYYPHGAVYYPPQQ